MIPHVPLNDGTTIPQLGFGTHKVAPDDAAVVVAQALDLGYRHIDTAQGYQNERGVGQAIGSSGLARSDVYVTTKLTNSQQGRDLPRLALLESLDELQLDYVDLYLIHWPVPARDSYIASWESLIECRREGLCKSIGVSNFNADHLMHIMDYTGEPPAVNQIEYHPEFVRTELQLVNEAAGIATEAWAPLGQNQGLLQLPLMVELADEYGVTPAQLALRWSVQLGLIPLVKSADLGRAKSNLDVFGWELTDDDLDAVSSLNADRRLGPDPATMNRNNRPGRDA
jgi:diketogulonate reductase-like aldo/keto reductase